MIAIGTMLAGVGAVAALFITRDDEPARQTQIPDTAASSGRGQSPNQSPNQGSNQPASSPQQRPIGTDPAETRVPVASGTTQLVDYFGSLEVDPDESGDLSDIDTTTRTIDAINAAQIAVMFFDPDRPIRYGDCATLPETAWVTTVRIQDIAHDARFCVRTAPKRRLGYLAIQEIAWRNPEHTEFSAITVHWETWPT